MAGCNNTRFQQAGAHFAQILRGHAVERSQAEQSRQGEQQLMNRMMDVMSRPLQQGDTYLQNAALSRGQFAQLEDGEREWLRSEGKRRRRQKRRARTRQSRSIESLDHDDYDQHRDPCNRDLQNAGDQDESYSASPPRSHSPSPDHEDDDHGFRSDCSQDSRPRSRCSQDSRPRSRSRTPLTRPRPKVMLTRPRDRDHGSIGQAGVQQQPPGLNRPGRGQRKRRRRGAQYQ